MSDTAYSMDEHSLYLTNYEGKTLALNGGDDDYLTFSFDNAAVTFKENARGKVQWHAKKISKGTISFSAQWGSTENKYLNKMFVDQLDGNPATASRIKRTTNSENETVMSSTGRVYLEKPADNKMGAEGGPRVWKIHVENVSIAEATEAIPG